MYGWISAAGIGVALSFVIWIMYGQMSEKDVQIGKLQGAVEVSNATIQNMNDQFSASMVALTESREAHHATDLKMQGMQYANNELRSTIDQRSQEAPFAAGVDDHNWFARWMQQVERAGGGDPASTDSGAAGQTNPVGVSPD